MFESIRTYAKTQPSIVIFTDRSRRTVGAKTPSQDTFT